MKSKLPSKTKLLSKSLLSILVALNSASLLAQSTPANSEKPAATKEVDEVVVLGVRKALESALDVKRTTTAIVDAISSEDIGNLPALDLGEALQAIPGIQISREGVDGERRTSTVSLRGFTGGFVLQTANGEDFANPQRSTAATSPNPFGAFEAGIFRGATVYKSLQADLIEGGIAGVVDKKLPNALKSKETGGTISLGTRYEELNDSFDPQFTLAGHTFLIEDRLAVYGILSGSEQNFRRDSINITGYSKITPQKFIGGQTAYDKYYKDNNLQPTDVLNVPSNPRQFSEGAGGDRLSFSGNIGFKATDALTLSADFLYSERNLDRSYNELEALVNEPNSRIGPISAPVFAGDYLNAGTGLIEKTYAVPAFNFENFTYSPGNRDNEILEKTEGVFLKALWEEGPLKLESTISKSDANNRWLQTGYNLNFRAATSFTKSNGVDGYFNTGGDNYQNYDLSLKDPKAILASHDLLPWVAPTRGDGTPTNTGSNAVAIQQNALLPNGGQVRFNITSGTSQLEREQTSWNFAGTLDLDLAFLDSVKAGGRFAKDDFVSTLIDDTVDGITNVKEFTGQAVYTAPSYVNSTEFFNGKSGYLTYEEGWLSVDLDNVTAILQKGLNPSPGREVDSGSGFVKKTPTNLGITNGQRNFNAESNSRAFFIMGNIQEYLTDDIELKGNVGVRYIETRVNGSTYAEILKPDNTIGIGIRTAPENRYSNTLPSLNLSLNLPEDLIVRFAANRGMTRPNLQNFTLSSKIKFDTTDNLIELTLPRSFIKPFTADALDLSLEWYNRPGSSVALTLFEKKFKGSIDTRLICPKNAGSLGTLTPSADGSICNLDTPFFNPADQPVQPLPPAPQLPPVYYNQIEITETFNSSSIRTVQGLEFSVQQNLDFLPGFWSGFGTQASYTVLQNVGQQPLAGISKGSYNFITYWENKTFSTRLSYNYRDGYTVEGGGSFVGSGDRSVVGRGQLDLSAKWNVIKHLNIGFTAHNLTDSVYVEYQGGSRYLPRRTNYDGRIYSMSVNYNF